jgi:hypothetical protein
MVDLRALGAGTAGVAQRWGEAVAFARRVATIPPKYH